MGEHEKTQKKRKIFCIITQGELGGAQQFIAQLAHHIDQNRFNLHIVWGSDSQPDLVQQLPSWVTYQVARHLVRPISPLHDMRAVFELRALIRANAPDVVLCISSKAGFVGARAAYGLRSTFPHLRIIYRIGGWTFNDPIPPWQRTLYITLERLSASWKDYIVLNNSQDYNQAQTLGIHPRKALLRIYNGIDPYVHFLDKEAARAALQEHLPSGALSPHTRLVGTIANFYATKDLATLIRAAAQSDDTVQYIVIGDGPQRAKLEQLIAIHRLTTRVLLAGRIPQAAQLLPAFDLFVLPSVKEGFPWALLEAMAAKVPVIATRVGAVPEMIEDHISGIIVHPGDSNAIAAAVRELFENDRLRQELAIQAHQQVIVKFGLRDMISQYEKLFES